MVRASEVAGPAGREAAGIIWWWGVGNPCLAARTRKNNLHRFDIQGDEDLWLDHREKEVRDYWDLTPRSF